MKHGSGSDPAQVPTDMAPDRAGYSLRVSGMDCASCAESVEKALRRVEGVEDVVTDVVTERVTVMYADDKLARDDLVGAIGRAGYRVEHGAGRRRVREREETP